MAPKPLLKNFHRGVRRWKLRFIALFRLIAGRQKRSIIFLLSEARGGSTFFQSMLCSLPDVGSVGEILHYHNASGRHPKERLWPLRLHLKAMPLLNTSKVVVLKVHLSHLERHGSSVDQLLQWFPDAHYLLQYRREIIGQYVSQLKATKTRVFAEKMESQNSKTVAVRIEPKDFQKYAHDILKRFVTAANQLEGHPRLILSYESGVSCPQQLFSEVICPFLNIEPSAVFASIKKQSRGSLEDHLENPSAIDACILTEPAAKLLHQLKQMESFKD